MLSSGHFFNQNSKLIKGHNYVKKTLMVTCLCCIDHLMKVKKLPKSEVNIYFNDTDVIIKCQSFCTMTMQMPPQDSQGLYKDLNIFFKKSKAKKIKDESHVLNCI